MSKVLRSALLLLACCFAAQATTVFIYFDVTSYNPPLTPGVPPILGSGTNLTTPASATATFSFVGADDGANPVDLVDFSFTSVDQMQFTVAYSDDQSPTDAATEAFTGQLETLANAVLETPVGGISPQTLGAGVSSQALDFNPAAATDTYLISSGFLGFVYRFQATTGDIRFRGVQGLIVVTAEATPVNAVPEPATSALAGGALVLLGLVGRRFRK